jgi:hypothetical protein
MSRSGRIITLVLAELLFFCASTRSQSVPNQVTPNNDTGVQPYEAYAGVRENINLANGNVNLQIPLVSLPGRNGHDFSLSLRYDSKTWQVHSETDPNSGQILYYWDGGGGWVFNLPWVASTLIHAYVNPNYPYSNYYCYGQFIVTTAGGSNHAFFGTQPLSGVRTGCYFIDNHGYITQRPDLNHPTGGAYDASYFFLDTSNSSDIVVRAKDGTTIHFPGALGYEGEPTKIEDSNGNSITIQTNGAVKTVTDTVGRSITITSGFPTTLITYKERTRVEPSGP